MTGPYTIARAPAIEVGVDAARRLPELIAGAGAVLIVDGALRVGYAGVIEAAVGPLAVCAVPPGEPTTESVDAVTEVVRAHPGALVVAVGGGSTLDTAKQAALACGSTESIEHYALAANPFPGRRTIIAVPTTSGTGSEVTRTCIFTNRAGRKVWTWDDGMLPDTVLLDPRATVTVPPSVTAATGLDAFVHAVEAASGQRRNRLVTAPAAQAMRLVLQHLPAAVADGTNLEARQGMQEAALLAGLAIDSAGTGVAHSIGHALGTLAKVPHGLAVAVGLQAALGWNVEGCSDAYTEIGGALGTHPGELVALFDGLAAGAALGRVVAGFGALRLTATELAGVMAAEENQPMLTNNARPADERARHLLAERTLARWESHLDGPQ